MRRTSLEERESLPSAVAETGSTDLARVDLDVVEACKNVDMGCVGEFW